MWLSKPGNEISIPINTDDAWVMSVSQQEGRIWLRFIDESGNGAGIDIVINGVSDLSVTIGYCGTAVQVTDYSLLTNNIWRMSVFKDAADTIKIMVYLNGRLLKDFSIESS